MRKKITLFSLFFILVASLLVSTLIPISSASVSYFEITPDNPVKGDIVKIAGTASAYEQVPIELSFEKDLSVAGGKYDWLLSSIEIPKGENRFTVTATNVKKLNVALKLGFWFTRSTDANENGFARISQSNVPGGNRKAKISGESVSESGTVKIKVEATVYLTAEANGNFEYSYDTSPIPLGEFKVKVGDGSARTIELLETRPTSTPTPTLPASGGGGGGGGGGASITPTPTPTPTPTTTGNVTTINNETVISTTPTSTPSPTPSPSPSMTPTPIPSVGDFSVTISPKHSKISSSRGSTINYTISISATDGFNSSIDSTLAVSGLGFNQTYTLPPQYPPYPKTYTYTVNIPGGVPPGVYTGTITATGGDITRTDSTTLEVPGFEAVFAIAGLLAVTYLVLRK